MSPSVGPVPGPAVLSEPGIPVVGSLFSVKSAQAAEGELPVVEGCSGVGDLPVFLDDFLRTSSRRCEGMYRGEEEDEEGRGFRELAVFK